eukprot:scaffold58609_cov40-Cyclotella_meneghiniana.AAC.1
MLSLHPYAVTSATELVKFSSRRTSLDGVTSTIISWDLGFEYKDVVLNEEGKIVQMGGKKQIDFNNIPGMMRRRAVPGARGCWGEIAASLDILFWTVIIRQQAVVGN